MNAIAKRIQELEQYMPDLTSPADLDQFWEQALHEASEHPLTMERVSKTILFEGIEAYRVAYRGFDETPIYGWYLIPRFIPKEKYPAVVLYHGYSGNKQLPEEYAAWFMLGVAVFAVDVRGQSGETGNALTQVGGMIKGWMTQNIMDKHSSYYKAIIIDAVRALDWIAEQPDVDPDKIGIIGGSQGGGLVLMTAILSSKAAYAVADVPNLCHMDYGVLHSTSSLTEVADYVKQFPDRLDAVLETLSYFDVMNLADRIRIPILVSVGLKDPVCMPETIYAAYNRIIAPKDLHVYPFSGHEISVAHRNLVMQYVKAFNDNA